MAIVPTASPVQVPTTSLQPTSSPTTVTEGLCTSTSDVDECIEVSSFADLSDAIDAAMLGGKEAVVFCGGFHARVPEFQELEIATSMKIICISQCTLDGAGTHLVFKGEGIQAEVQNVKFISASESAIRISTDARSTVTFCGCHFRR